MHHLVVLCDHYGPERAAQFRADIAAGRLVTRGHVPALVAVAASFEERPWEGAVELALAEYESQDRGGHWLSVRGWAVLGATALDRLARSAAPLFGTAAAFADFIAYGPSHATNVAMVLRDAQVGMFEHTGFDQAVLQATSEAGLYHVTRVEESGRGGRTLVRHADGTALAFATEAEVQAALASLLASAPPAAPGSPEPAYAYRAVAPAGPGLPLVNPLGLTPALAAAVAQVLPAETLSDAGLLHGVVLADGTALVRLEDSRVSWFVVTAGPHQDGQRPHDDETDDASVAEILAYLDRSEPGIDLGPAQPHVSVHATAADAEPSALVSPAAAR